MQTFLDKVPEDKSRHANGGGLLMTVLLFIALLIALNATAVPWLTAMWCAYVLTGLVAFLWEYFGNRDKWDFIATMAGASVALMAFYLGVMLGAQ